MSNYRCRPTSRQRKKYLRDQYGRMDKDYLDPTRYVSITAFMHRVERERKEDDRIRRNRFYRGIWRKIVIPRIRSERYVKSSNQPGQG